MCVSDRRGNTALYDEDGTFIRDSVCVPNLRTLNRDFQVLQEYLRVITTTRPNVRGHILDFFEDLLMYTDVSVYAFTEIMNGAFTVICGDRGYFHTKYLSQKYRKQFWVPMSSHKKFLDKQYRLGSGELVICPGEHMFDCSSTAPQITNPNFDLLFGLYKVVPFRGDTAFQFEKTRMDTFPNSIAHIKDFLHYKKDKTENLGIFGKSHFTDRNPLFIYVDKAYQRKHTGGRPRKKLHPSRDLNTRPHG